MVTLQVEKLNNNCLEYSNTLKWSMAELFSKPGQYGHNWECDKLERRIIENGTLS